MSKTIVAKSSEVSIGKAIAVDVAGKRIALFNINGKFFAIDDECTHASGPLSEGEIDGNTVTCPWHGATFDVSSGLATGAPAFEGVKSYKITVEGENISIEL